LLETPWTNCSSKQLFLAKTKGQILGDQDRTATSIGERKLSNLRAQRNTMEKHISNIHGFRSASVPTTNPRGPLPTII